MDKNKKNTGPTNLTLIGSIIVLVAIASTTAVSWLLYEHTVNLLTDNLRERLLSIAITQAANIDAKNIDALQVEDDWKKPEWNNIVSRLKKTKSDNPNIVFLYIFRKKADDPSQMEFVADAESMNPYANLDDNPENDVDANGDGIVEPDGADNLQWPGQEYPEPPQETFEAYAGPLTSEELYEDAYGQVLTGYAPIKDENGIVVAVIGVDIKVNDFLTVTRQTLYPFLSFILFLISAIIILSVVLIKLWNKRVEIFAELDKQKDELLSIVSHQLATPVSSIKWYTEMMMDGDLGKITAQQKEHLGSMMAVAGNLSDLVSMILDVSRIQLGRMHIEKQELDLGDFFKEILEIIKPKATEKKINFEINMPSNFPKAALDKRYTHMTIENLLSNAIKYTPESGHVQFFVEVKGGRIYCKVKDSGVGIPKADQDKIFGKMFRASNVRNAIDGNGFGLYVAKGAVEAQGGKIWFESAEGEGTTFDVELPLKD